MDGSNDRDPDTVADEMREATYTAVNRGEPGSNWTQDDQDYVGYADELDGANNPEAGIDGADLGDDETVPALLYSADEDEEDVYDSDAELRKIHALREQQERGLREWENAQS